MQLECWDSAGCNADNVLRALRNPTRSASASVFCSEYLQSTSTVCTTITVTEIETGAITTATTALTTDASTTTVTCAAAPTLLPTCGFETDDFPIYMISSTPSTNPTTCHEKCLADPNCKDFQVQVGGNSYCNLYNAREAWNVQSAPSSQYFFYRSRLSAVFFCA